MRLQCVVCKKGTEKFSAVRYMDADGLEPPNGKRSVLGNECRGSRSLVCDAHQESHVVFIDNSSMCPQCGTNTSDELYNAEPDKFEKFFKQLARATKRGDRKAFLRVMRNATTSFATPGECLVRAIVAFSLRYSVTVEVAIRFACIMVVRYRSFFVILPSSDPQKRFIPKP